MKRSASERLRLLATSTLTIASLWLAVPVVLHAQQGSSTQNGYQGVSQPPADEVIEATPEAVPARAKPMPGVPAGRSNYTSSRPASSVPGAPAGSAGSAAGDLSDPNSADYGIVSSVPATGTAAPERAAGTASGGARLISRPENPDYGVVTMVPSPSNQLAEGTDIRVRLLDGLSSGTTQGGASFRGQVAADVYKEGHVVIPVGSELRGRVVSVTQGHRMGAPATLRLRPEAVLLPDGTSYHLYAQAIHSDAPGTRTDAEGGIQPSSRVARNLVELGAGSGGGAATGAIFGGPVGAGVGALVGAGVVTAHLLLQHPHQANVEQGSELVFSLTEPMDLLPTRN